MLKDNNILSTGISCLHILLNNTIRELTNKKTNTSNILLEQFKHKTPEKLG